MKRWRARRGARAKERGRTRLHGALFYLATQFAQITIGSVSVSGFRKARREAVFLICAVHLAIVRDWHFASFRCVAKFVGYWTNNGQRSEEHTSELQSLRHLVCRLLLE